jgi:hypothetical protein
MAFGQLEKLLMKASLEPQFRREMVRLGETAGARYACGEDEARLLAELLANQGAGLAAVLAVIEAAIDARLSLGLSGKLPHEIVEDRTNPERSGDVGTAMSRYVG